MFSCIICKISNNTFFKEHLWWLLLENLTWKKVSTNIAVIESIRTKHVWLSLATIKRMNFNKSILYKLFQNFLTAFLTQFQFTGFFFNFFNSLVNKNKAAKLEMLMSCVLLYTAQKMKFSIKDFFSKRDQFRSILCSDSRSI